MVNNYSLGYCQKGETSSKGWGNVMCFGIRIGVGGGHATGKGRGWGNIVERVLWRERVGEHHRKGETSSKRGNIIERVGKHCAFQNTNWCGWWPCDWKGERVGKCCGKGETSWKGWGNIVPGETLSTHFRLCNRKGERVDARQTESSRDLASCGSEYEVRGGVWVVAMCVS